MEIVARVIVSRINKKSVIGCDTLVHFILRITRNRRERVLGGKICRLLFSQWFLFCCRCSSLSNVDVK